MKRLLFISLLFLVGFSGIGQNLVPNPSFEVVTPCPTTLHVIYNAVPWNAAHSTSSSDIYHACGTPNLFSVPINLMGEQLAHTGDGYAAHIFYSSNSADNREYIQVQLTDSLNKDSLYRVSFYVNLADQAHWAINRIGATLTVDSLWTTLDRLPFPNTPVVEHDSTIVCTDSVNWTLVTGTYIAQGGEQWITIGNFYYDSSTTVQQGFGGQPHAYYYVDDVSVLLESNGGGEGIEEGDKEKQLTFYPNPTTGLFTIQGATSEIQIFDLFGRLVLRTNIPQIDMSSYPAGLYVWQVGAARGKLVLE